MLPRIKNRAAARASTAASGFGSMPGGQGGASVGAFPQGAMVGAPRPGLPGAGVPGIPGRDAFGPINPIAPVGPFVFPPGAIPPAAPPAGPPAAPPGNPLSNPMAQPQVQLVPYALPGMPGLPLGTANIMRLSKNLRMAILNAWGRSQALSGIDQLLRALLGAWRTIGKNDNESQILAAAEQEVAQRLATMGETFELVE